MTQANSAIMVAIELSMEYAKLCMSMRLGNARYPAAPGQATDEDAGHASVNRMLALNPGPRPLLPPHRRSARLGRVP